MGSQSAATAAIRRTSHIVAVALLVTAGAPALAAEPRLSLADAQRIAVARSSQLTAYDAAAASAREMAVAAGRLPDPVATLGVNNLPVNGDDAWSLTRDFMTMRSVGVMQELTRKTKREARTQRFEREAEKAIADRSAGSAAIRRDTALAWLDRHYSEAMLAVVGEQSEQARIEVEASEGAYRAGRGSLSETLAARSALVSLDDRASELARRARVARITLARWLGEAADAPLAAAPSMDAIAVDPRTLESELEHHPETAVLARKVAIAAAEVTVARENAKADWSVALMYSQRGPGYSNMLSVNVSVPLQWDHGNRQDREVAAKLAQLDQARAEREDMLRAHDAEVRALIAEWESGRERAARYERELLPLAVERTQATLGAYRGAKASLGDVLLSHRNEIEVRLQLLQLQMDTARVWAQLNFLVPEGMDVHAADDRRKESQ